MTANRPDALAHLLFGPILEPVVSTRLDKVADEVRVAQVIAHLKPFSGQEWADRYGHLARRLPGARIPSQRRVTHPAEQRLDDIASAHRQDKEARRARASRR